MPYSPEIDELVKCKIREGDLIYSQGRYWMSQSDRTDERDAEFGRKVRWPLKWSIRSGKPVVLSEYDRELVLKQIADELEMNHSWETYRRLQKEA